MIVTALIVFKIGMTHCQHDNIRVGNGVALNASKARQLSESYR